MHSLIREVQKEQLRRVPEVKTGYTVRIHQRIKEGEKERTQIFEGLVIKTGHGEGSEKTITVRKIVQGIGVEKTFPLHSPNVTKIEVKKKAKVRRSKLYYMRERSGKSARLQERHVTDAERAEEESKMDAMIQEAVKADEKKKAEEIKAEAPEAVAEVSDDAVQAEAPEAVEPAEKVAEEVKEEAAPAAEDSEPAKEVAEEAPAEEEEKPAE
ncbi:50S ribosomal protein L19 [Candidatus Pacearchaeota archaeon]|nr:50S ribosomal protein L19 [Candidatus Pacearchaeota archaeon]